MIHLQLLKPSAPHVVPESPRENQGTKVTYIYIIYIVCSVVYLKKPKYIFHILISSDIDVYCILLYGI